MKQSRVKGFTLIELLVVIAIIGLLSSVIIAPIQSARMKAREAKRVSEVKQLKIAMEIFFDDNGRYPTYGSSDTGYSMSLLTAPLAGYMSKAPVDPLPAIAWLWVWGSGGASYGLYIYREKTNDYCRTGVNVNTGWWGAIPTCDF